MIRKVILTICLLLALVTLVIGAVSYRLAMGYVLGRSSNPPVYIMQCIKGRYDVYQISTTPNPVRGVTYLTNNWPLSRHARDTVLGYSRCQAPAVTPDRLLAYTIFTTPNDISCLPIGSYVANADIVQIRMGFWIPLVFFLICPAIAFYRDQERRHRRRKKGLCLKCGYNLTGNVSGICPECGVDIAKLKR